MKHVHVRIPKLEAENSREVFVLFSALNAMGYDDENNIRGMSPARQRIRKILLRHDWDKRYPKLKKAIGSDHPWHLLNAVLTKPKIKKTSVLNTFISDIRKFSQEPLIRKLWTVFRIYQAEETKKLSPLFKEEATRLIKFISQPTRDIKRIVLIVNPLDAYWRGYGFGIGETGYVVVGPGIRRRQSELIRHELLHVLTPPFQIPRRITAGQSRKRLAALGYGSLSAINREYVVRSLNLLYEEAILKKDISQAIKHAEKDFPNIKEALAFMKTKKERGRL